MHMCERSVSFSQTNPSELPAKEFQARFDYVLTCQLWARVAHYGSTRRAVQPSQPASLLHRALPADQRANGAERPAVGL